MSFPFLIESFIFYLFVVKVSVLAARLALFYFFKRLDCERMVVVFFFFPSIWYCTVICPAEECIIVSQLHTSGDGDEHQHRMCVVYNGKYWFLMGSYLSSGESLVSILLYYRTWANYLGSYAINRKLSNRGNCILCIPPLYLQLCSASQANLNAGTSQFLQPGLFGMFLCSSMLIKFYAL